MCFAVECDPRPETFVITRLASLVEGAEADMAAISESGEIVGGSDTWYGRAWETPGSRRFSGATVSCGNCPALTNP